MAITLWSVAAATAVALSAAALVPQSAMAAVDGQKIYTQNCAGCHTSGGAPRRGTQKAWSSPLDQGMPTLYTHAIEGYKGMPARGGNASLSEDEVKAAVDYLVAPVKAVK